MDRLFSTTTLVGALAAMDRPVAFLRDTFFATTIQFTTTEIAFDKLKRRRKLAPFVSPRVAGKARQPRGRTVSTFEPAYVKPKHEVSPDEGFVRIAGEALGGALDADARYNAAVLQSLLDEDDEITRREEWMCSQILQTGQVVVSGEDYPSQTVNFGRVSGHTVTLSGGARWGQSGVKVMSSIRSWATLVSNNSGGAVRQVIMGPTAAELFVNDVDVRDILNNRRQQGGAVELAPVVGGVDSPAAFLGSIGQFDFWQYAQKYEDESGTTQDLFPAAGVSLIAPGALEGVMAYGAIRDVKASLQPLPRFPKMWDQEDPSTTFLMTQSAPLPVPREVNATLFATVA
jgi:hypothetical protein